MKEIRGIRGEAKIGGVGKMRGIRRIIGISFLMVVVMGFNIGLLAEEKAKK